MSATPIVALDVPDVGKALELVDALGDRCGYYKIGSEFFTSAGRAAVEAVRGRGKRVFLDLKFHDIPNTVRAGCREATAMGASLITVHALGGPGMISAAVEGAGDRAGVLAVTVLTSHDAAELGILLGKAPVDVSEEVGRLAQVAHEAGARGVVCSGHEASRLRAAHGPEFELLVPGIRLSGGAAHDQKRVMTPSEAASAGATYLVLGRAVTAAIDPAAAMAAVIDDLR